MSLKKGQKIFLTGTCWYELTGLWHMLSAHGYDVYCDLPGFVQRTEHPNLIIVALSAEPLAGWGRHLSRIRDLRKQMSGRMLVLTPEKLNMLAVLHDICEVCSGCDSLRKLKTKIHSALTRESFRPSSFRLTEGQRWVLEQLSERSCGRPLFPKRGDWEWYYHHARLAENVGVRDFRLLLMTGLERELSKMVGHSECKVM